MSAVLRDVAAPTSFRRVAEGLPVAPVARALEANPALWGEHGMRKATYAHGGMTDIWVRYNAVENLGPAFNDRHVPVWYPAAASLPVAPIWRALMALTGGEMLGGILITKVQPGGEIKPHVDAGWHAGYFSKFYVALQNEPGAVFGWSDGELHARAGEAYWFRNDRPHWVKNASAADRLAMIVCIRTEKRGFGVHG